MTYINGKEMEKEDCENVKHIISKYGYTLVCDEERPVDLILPAGNECDGIVKVASKYGVTVVCKEDD